MIFYKLTKRTYTKLRKKSSLVSSFHFWQLFSKAYLPESDSMAPDLSCSQYFQADNDNKCLLEWQYIWVSVWARLLMCSTFFARVGCWTVAHTLWHRYFKCVSSALLIFLQPQHSWLLHQHFQRNACGAPYRPKNKT